MRRRTLLAPILLVLSAGCTDLAEFDGTYSAGLLVISTPGLTVSGSTGPIPGARSVCAMGGRIWVASTEGRILDYDSTTLELGESRLVGAASPSAYTEMVFNAPESSVYLVGPFGTILEIGFPEGDVEDEFSVCEAPSLLQLDFAGEYMYVSDAATSRVIEVRLATNLQSRVCQLPALPLSICGNGMPEDTLVVGTQDGLDLLIPSGTGILKRIPIGESLALQLTDIPEDTVHCGVIRTGSTDAVAVMPVFFPDSMGVFDPWEGYVPLSGELHLLCPGRDLTHAYVLCYLGSAGSRLVSYDYRLRRIDGELSIDGYPMDMEMTPGGNLVVLTIAD